MRKGIAILTGVAALALVNISIVGKERHLATGKVVLLELAPVDPRSLMQGDYMALNYRIAQAIGTTVADGRLIAALDARSVATFRRLDDGQALAPGEIRLRYRVRNGQLKFATNAFFFEEGTASRYQDAGYGEFRVDDRGELLLTALRGRDLRPLG